MCGRFSLTTSSEALTEHFKLSRGIYAKPRYNISPGEVIPILKNPGELEFLKWGFIPHFKTSNEKQEGFINARSETVLDRPSFKTAFLKRRCLILVDGFYEWKNLPRIKQPFYIHRKDSSVFALAGIWEGETCAILTVEANELLMPVHPRMPVIIPPDKYNDWLKGSSAPEIAKALLTAYPSECLEIYPVTSKMNNANFESPACVYSLHSS
jgi:putative SOS response-associated peptidase YedK